jgi:hypothetical protein
MNHEFGRTRIAVAVAAAFGAVALGSAPDIANAEKSRGTYLSGDFHNHTTCSDGSISMQKLVKKSTDKVDTPWGLDWFVQAGHGGNGNRNCTLVEDESLATPAYPFLSGPTPFNTATPPSVSQYNGPQTTWAQSIGAANVKGNAPNGGVALSTQANPAMWRWQSIQEFQYPLMEYLSALKGLPLFIGMESVVAGHEHTSMSVITGQMPAALDFVKLPTTPGYTPLGNATALSQWSYCFDRGDTDWSRGNNSIADPTGNSWNCSVTGSLNAADPNWNATAQKLLNNSGTAGHAKTVEALKWMKEFHPNGSYYVPAHLERAGPFNPTGTNGFNVEHLRDFNNTAPDVAFGFETQPGHHASDQRGEYTIRRNNIGGTRFDSVGGTTFGGTGVYGAIVGGVWDALLGEGRNWWFFASSDWHNRGSFGPDDRRSTQDFYPGEYQRNYTMVRSADRDDRRRGKPTPQTIVDGLRSGNNFAAMGQLIDRLAFVACVGNPAPHGRSAQAVESLALNAARDNTDVDFKGCATMGEKLVVPKGSDIVVAIVVRDPAGTNYSPYSFPNPSLKQVGISQPLNAPVLDHVDVIRGMVTSMPKKPGDADYAGAWPDNWLDFNANPQVQPALSSVPAAAKNTTAAVIKTFSDATWASVRRDPEYKVMTFRIPNVKASQYVRLRGTNLPAGVPFETDARGNPLADLWTNAAAVAFKTDQSAEFPAGSFLRIPCTTAGTTEFNGCPSHLPVVNGVKYAAFDVAAWSDLWFYSNPIYVEVAGSTTVAGVKADDSTKAAQVKAKGSRIVAEVKSDGSPLIARAN